MVACKVCIYKIKFFKTYFIKMPVSDARLDLSFTSCYFEFAYFLHAFITWWNMQTVCRLSNKTQQSFILFACTECKLNVSLAKYFNFLRKIFQIPAVDSVTGVCRASNEANMKELVKTNNIRGYNKKLTVFVHFSKHKMLLV